MNLADLFGQAKDIQAKAEAMQNELALIEVEGRSGGGLVRVLLGGKGDLKHVEIAPELIKPEEGTTIQDLLIAAHADAKSKLEARIASEMGRIAGALGLPAGLGPKN